MRIEKGLVKDQGYPDCELTYGVLDNNTQYYFVENGDLSSGKIIASTVLKEAIGHAKNTSLGLIDQDGNVIIPFENKLIKLVNDRYLLVERNIPQDVNVNSSLKSKNDPLAATKLVTTAATLKEKVSKQMGVTGRFLFNDQFSEATLCDLDGKNLLNGQYYSYIGINESKVFYTKNTIDAEVFSVDLTTLVKEENKDVTFPPVDAPVVEDSKIDEPIDVTKVALDQNMVNAAVDKKEEEQAKTYPTVDAPEVAIDQNMVNAVVDKKEEEQAENVPIAVDVKEEPVKEEVQLHLAGDEKEAEEVPVAPISLETDIDTEKNEEPTLDFSFEKTITPEEIALPVVEEEVKEPVALEEKEKNVVLPDEVASTLDSFALGDTNSNISSVDNLISDSILEDVAGTMKELIDQNKEQKTTLEKQDAEIEVLESHNKELTSKSNTQMREINTLRDRISKFETMVAKLEAKNQLLDNQITDLEKTVQEQEDELNVLRPQVAGKEAFAQLLVAANETLGKDDLHI